MNEGSYKMSIQGMKEHIAPAIVVQATCSYLHQNYRFHSSSAPDLGLVLFERLASSGLKEFTAVCQPKRYGITNCTNSAENMLEEVST